MWSSKQRSRHRRYVTTARSSALRRVPQPAPAAARGRSAPESHDESHNEGGETPGRPIGMPARRLVLRIGVGGTGGCEWRLVGVESDPNFLVAPRQVQRIARRMGVDEWSVQQARLDFHLGLAAGTRRRTSDEAWHRNEAQFLQRVLLFQTVPQLAEPLPSLLLLYAQGRHDEFEAAFHDYRARSMYAQTWLEARLPQLLTALLDERGDAR